MTTADAGPSETVLGDLELTRSLAIQMTAITLLGFVVSWALFGLLFEGVTGQSLTLQFAPAGVDWWTDAMDVLVVLFLATVFVVPHELLHGLAIRYYGGWARYGVGLAHFVLPYAYATTDHEFTRNQFVVVLLTPLVVITALGLPLALAFEWGWLVVPLAANAAGAAADVWMTLTLLSYPAHVRLEDHRDGVRILGREDDRARPLSVTAFVWDAIAGVAVAAVGAVLVLAVGGPIALSALGVESLTVGTPGTIRYLFAFTNTPTELSMGVGPGVFGLAALLGLTYAFVQSYRRR